MNKLFLSIILTCFTAIAFPQTNKTTYYLPDSTIIPEDKLDSINKVWGNKGFMMKHDPVHPDDVYISPMTDDYVKRFEINKARMEKMLNHPAPNFSLSDIKGNRWSLSALKGKTVVLNFWFVTCAACVEEVPKLNSLKKDYADSNTVFLGFALDDKQSIKQFLVRHPFTYILFPESKAVGDSFQVTNYPTSIIIDKLGIIRFQQVGIDGNNDIGEKLRSEIKRVDKM